MWPLVSALCIWGKAVITLWWLWCILPKSQWIRLASAHETAALTQGPQISHCYSEVEVPPSSSGQTPPNKWVIVTRQTQHLLMCLPAAGRQAGGQTDGRTRVKKQTNGCSRRGALACSLRALTEMPHSIWRGQSSRSIKAARVEHIFWSTRTSQHLPGKTLWANNHQRKKRKIEGMWSSFLCNSSLKRAT